MPMPGHSIKTNSIMRGWLDVVVGQLINLRSAFGQYVTWSPAFALLDTAFLAVFPLPRPDIVLG